MNTQTDKTAADPTSDLLKGAPAWIITDGKAGMLVQAKGVADALGLDYVLKDVNLSGIWRWTSPWGPVPPKDKFGQPGSKFAPPWPKIAIATGRAAIPYIRALRRHARGKTYTVVLQDPKTGPNTADLIWVPAHDRRRGPNVFTTLTPPHSFSQARLHALRANLPPDILNLPSPRVAVILGGKNSVYKFTQEDDLALEHALRSLKDIGASFMITPSRRSHARLIQSAECGTNGAARIIWDSTGENPYPNFLAAADILIVTADSVNMCGEACATGKPVFVFTPSGGSAKFTRFHDGLKDHRATRPLPIKFDAIPSWSYAPINSADRIAHEIKSRYSTRNDLAEGPIPDHGLSSAHRTNGAQPTNNNHED